MLGLPGPACDTPPFRAPLSLNANKIEASWSTVYYEYDRQNFVLTVGKSVVLDYSATNVSTGSRTNKEFVNFMKPERGSIEEARLDKVLVPYHKVLVPYDM